MDNHNSSDEEQHGCSDSSEYDEDHYPSSQDMVISSPMHPVRVALMNKRKKKRSRQSSPFNKNSSSSVGVKEEEEEEEEGENNIAIHSSPSRRKSTQDDNFVMDDKRTPIRRERRNNIPKIQEEEEEEEEEEENDNKKKQRRQHIVIGENSTSSIKSNETYSSERNNEKKLFFMDSGLKVGDLIDASLYRITYKEQFTVTGMVKKVKIRQEDAPQEIGKRISLNGRDIALFRFKSTIYAIQAKCPHQGGNLFAGDIEELDMNISQNSSYPGNSKALCIVCPWHGWAFSLETGESRHAGCEVTGSVYETRVSLPFSETSTIEIGFQEFANDLFNTRKVDF